MSNLNLVTLATFSTIEAEQALQIKLISASQEQAKNANANYKSRLRQHAELRACTESELQFMIDNSSIAFLDEFSVYKCNYTARNIRQYAQYAVSGKSNAMCKKIEQALDYLKKNNAKASVLVYAALNKDAGRDNKIIKTMQFYNLVKIENKSFRDAISKEDNIILV